MAAILFLKKTEKFFFSNLKGSKIKNKFFYGFIPGFTKRLGRIVFEH